MLMRSITRRAWKRATIDLPRFCSSGGGHSDFAPKRKTQINDENSANAFIEKVCIVYCVKLGRLGKDFHVLFIYVSLTLGRDRLLSSPPLPQAIEENRVMVFMKGTPEQPQCGFSAQVVRILHAEGAEFASANVLEDMDLREGIKKFSYDLRPFSVTLRRSLISQHVH